MTNTNPQSPAFFSYTSDGVRVPVCSLREALARRGLPQDTLAHHFPQTFLDVTLVACPERWSLQALQGVPWNICGGSVITGFGQVGSPDSSGYCKAQAPGYYVVAEHTDKFPGILFTLVRPG